MENPTEQKPVIDPSHELPVPHDMELENPHDMLLQKPQPHFTHKHSWILWTPALFGLFVGMIVGVFLITGMQTNLKLINTKPPETPAIPTPKIKPMVSRDKVYINDKLNLRVTYTDFYTPVEKFSPPKSGEPIFIVTDKFNFNKDTLTLCKTFKESICLIPGKNWNQQQDIQPVMLAGKNAVSYFISVLNQDGYNNVLHIVQTVENPFIEIALSVDGMGGEETFQNILSSVTFMTITPTTTISGNNPVVCTMDAKQCPDGSFVGRSGPKCEFLPCPTGKSNQ